MAIKKIEIYILRDVPIDDIITRYASLVTTPIQKVVNVSGITCEGTEGMNVETEIITKPSPRSLNLYHKFTFLIHLIISRSIVSKTGQIQLHSERLKNVLGSDYNNMLDALVSCNIIQISSAYLVGNRCRLIHLKSWDIDKKVSKNQKVIEYLAKWDKLANADIRKHEEFNEIELAIKMINGKLTAHRKSSVGILPKDLIKSIHEERQVTNSSEL